MRTAKRSAATALSPPVWSGEDASAIEYLTALEQWHKAALVASKREAGASEEEIARVTPQEIAVLTAVYAARRDEARARLRRR